jgi:hypothetical protein
MHVATKYLVALLSGAISLLVSQSVQGQAPYAKTQVAAPIRATTATLNGMAVPRGQQTYAWFEWGTNTTYGNVTAAQYISNGTHVVRVTNLLTGLIEGGVYHFRIVASNSVGVTRGFDFMFTTAMKIQNWGYWLLGPPQIPPGLTNISGIAGGHRHSLAIRNDGSLVAWMQCFPFTTPAVGQTSVPAGLSNVVSVAGGFSHCLAVTGAGTVVTWGAYADGTAPTVPSGLSNVIAVAGGDYHSVALKSDGTVVEWSSKGETAPFNLVDVVAISCGSSHTLALKANGTVTVWGSDLGATAAPSSETSLVAVATMGYWNAALRTNGTTLEWGLPVSSDVAKPANISNVVAITTGYSSVQVLKSDGTVVGWGNANDVLAIPPQLSNVVAIAGGDYYMTGLGPGNLPPRAYNVSARGPTNTPISISLSASSPIDPNGDPVVFKITSLPIAGSLYQYTSNGPGDQIVAPGTFLTDTSRVIFMPAPGVYGSPG